jgi:hypothetical protein
MEALLAVARRGMDALPAVEGLIAHVAERVLPRSHAGACGSYWCYNGCINGLVYAWEGQGYHWWCGWWCDPCGNGCWVGPLEWCDQHGNCSLQYC